MNTSLINKCCIISFDNNILDNNLKVELTLLLKNLVNKHNVSEFYYCGGGYINNYYFLLIEKLFNKNPINYLKEYDLNTLKHMDYVLKTFDGYENLGNITVDEIIKILSCLSMCNNSDYIIFCYDINSNKNKFTNFILKYIKKENKNHFIVSNF